MPAPLSPRPTRTASSKAVLGVGAVLLALWLGTTAPSVSPVSAGGPASVTTVRADLPLPVDRVEGGRDRRR